MHNDSFFLMFSYGLLGEIFRWSIPRSNKVMEGILVPMVLIKSLKTPMLFLNPATGPRLLSWLLYSKVFYPFS